MSTKEERVKKVREITMNAVRLSHMAMHGGRVVIAPEILWHYTNADALEAILETKKIYSTQFKHLNDTSEIKLFSHIAIEIASQKVKELPKIDDTVSVKTPEQFKTTLWHIINGVAENLVCDATYIACFSEIGDLLGQWREYADNCKGYAVGLSTEWLKDQSANEASFRLLKVIYHPNQQRAFISRFLDLTIDGFSIILSEAGESDQDDTLDLMIAFLKKLFAELSPIVKHPGYADEREWRLYSFGNHMEEHSYNDRLRRFEKINLNDAKRGHPFREIKIGPGNNIKNQESELGLILDEIGLKNDIKISRSIIPVRPA